MAMACEALGTDAEGLVVVARLLVGPDRRHRGIGTLLLAQATAEATGLGLQPILDVATHLTAAIALYESLGWHRLATVMVGLGDLQLAEHVYCPKPPRYRRQVDL
jgi:GNAT superfamily N-acetyltransferase